MHYFPLQFIITWLMKIPFTFYIWRRRPATSCGEIHRLQNVMTCPVFVNIELVKLKRTIIVCESGLAVLLEIRVNRTVMIHYLLVLIRSR